MLCEKKHNKNHSIENYKNLIEDEEDIKEKLYYNSNNKYIKYF